MCRQNAALIEPKLKELKLAAHDVDMDLYHKLDHEWRQIKKCKSGFIQSKKYLLDYLLELIKDIEFYIELQRLSLDDQEKIFSELSTPELFWFRELFPRWIRTKDEKYLIWRPQLASREPKNDESFIKKLNREIEKNNGKCLWRNIIDYSMATDLIVSQSAQTAHSALCVQLTVSKDAEDKKRRWEMTLKLWGIERGLFISIKPGQDDKKLERLAKIILNKSTLLETGQYVDLSL
jgi:hypothetical protein